MGHDGGQKKPGTQFIRETRGSDRGTPFKDPLAGDGLSTHTDFSKSSQKANDKGGKQIEGQNLRGYVHNGKGTNVGAIEDVTVAPDGTRRVKKSG